MPKKKAAASGKRRAKAAKRKTTKTDGTRTPKRVEAIATKHNLLPRQHQVLAAIAGGVQTSHGEILRAAGYSERSAEHPGEILGTARMRAALSELLAPMEKIAERLNEGLDAVETETYVNLVGSKLRGDEHIELQHVDKIAWTERRKYAELQLRLQGLIGNDVTVNGDVNVPIQVEFINVATLAEP